MPYLFIDDGHPESRDFADNYVWFDAEDAESIARAQEIAAQVAQLRGSPVGDFSVVATGSPSGEAVVEIPYPRRGSVGMIRRAARESTGSRPAGET